MLVVLAHFLQVQCFEPQAQHICACDESSSSSSVAVVEDNRKHVPQVDSTLPSVPSTPCTSLSPVSLATLPLGSLVTLLKVDKQEEGPAGVEVLEVNLDKSNGSIASQNCQYLNSNYRLATVKEIVDSLQRNFVTKREAASEVEGAGKNTELDDIRVDFDDKLNVIPVASVLEPRSLTSITSTASTLPVENSQCRIAHPKSLGRMLAKANSDHKDAPCPKTGMNLDVCRASICASTAAQQIRDWQRINESFSVLRVKNTFNQVKENSSQVFAVLTNEFDLLMFLFSAVV